MNSPRISVVIPTLNEEGNIRPLIERLDASLQENKISYELIFIDDHSTDATRDVIQSFSISHPIFCYLKKGQRGKAFSLLEGFEYAAGELVAILDADLQYPPEAIPEMIEKVNTGSDIIVTNRIEHQEELLRKIVSKMFTVFFTRLLHGLTVDVQSGLKVFRRKILSEVILHPTQWTFDLEFLLKARHCGYTIAGHEIVFSERLSGESKIHLWKTIYEIGSNALAWRFKSKQPACIRPYNGRTMIGAGLAHRKRRFVTHTTLAQHVSALRSFTTWQKLGIAFIVSLVVMGFLTYPYGTALTIMGVLSAIYFIDVVFNLYLVIKSLRQPPDIHFSEQQLQEISDGDMPVYTILCPLYKEAHILPHFLSAIGKLEWPKDKLDVLLLLEENDTETIQAAEEMSLPSYVRIIVVPHSMPKTKPKACNYGLSYAKGTYLVIYDAEDIPEPFQLKKAYLAFKKVPASVKCLQAKLNYYNPHQNLLTRLFTAEYSLWFDVTLTGLQSINTYIPLGGTSNHFRTKDLLELQGWDPFNVTEDCDLGIRLFKRGSKTAIIDSTTLEEANSSIKNWLRQRSRWIKGYMQTYLVHMRNPISFVRENGAHAFIFQLVVGGKIAFSLINPILWLATISYFALYSIVGPTIESLYPPVIFFMAAMSLVFGNFLFLYYYMIGCAKRRHWELIKYIYFVPLYWLMTSIAAYIAFYQLIVKPHYWEKTHHGLHLEKEKKITAPVLQPVRSANPLQRLVSRFMPEGLPEGTLSSGGTLIAVMMLSNLINLVFNAYLGRALSLEDLGLIAFINTLWYVAVVFTTALSRTVNHKTAYLAAANKIEEGVQFMKATLAKGIYIAIAVSLVWLIAAPALARFFNVSELISLLAFTPVLTFGVIAAVNGGYLHGMLRFKAVATIFFSESIIKLASAVVLVQYGFGSIAYVSIPLSIIGSAIVSFMVLRVAGSGASQTRSIVFPGRFYTASIFAGISSVIFLSLDMILVKHYLPAAEVGQYALLSLIGKMIFFLGMLPNIFMMTLVSRDEGLKQSSRRSFRLIFGSSLTLLAIGVLSLGPFGSITVPLLLGEKALAIVPYLNIYAISLALFSLANVYVTYHLAKKHYIFPAVSLVMSVLMAVGIIQYHASIQQIVQVIFSVSSLGMAIMLGLHVFEPRLTFIRRNVLDFLGAFSQLPFEPSRSPDTKNILMFNWRDTKHVFNGGAEVYIQEMAKQWVAQGHQVTIFCGNDGKSLRNEVIDGVNIIRRGGFYFVYIWAFVYYILKFRGAYDVIIDCHNGIPFFTPLYTTKQVYCLMHHVHQDVFRRSLSKPLALIATFMESTLMPLIYRRVPFITVSESSKEDIQKIGLGRSGIDIVHPGVHLRELQPGEKSPVPTILYLGRLKAYKSIDILILAFRRVLQKMPDAELVIAGSGEEDQELERITHELGIADKVIFRGKVEESEKISLLQKAWVLVNPSFMEGWGITTIEANACGTPVVASNVPGLRDSVQNPRTGYLVSYGDSEAFADSILTILENEYLRHSMVQESLAWAKNFDWQKTSDYFLSVINSRPASIRNSYGRATFFGIFFFIATLAAVAFGVHQSWAHETVRIDRDYASEAIVDHLKIRKLDTASVSEVSSYEFFLETLTIRKIDSDLADDGKNPEIFHI